ncbi:MAG TPA: sodium:proton antiporter [Bacteroidales bacterium]|nr:cation:proton antiporter [Bacteroidales bacterium]HQK37273.1 sodium:proton antiporter [Bacteroidales bacterium]
MVLFIMCFILFLVGLYGVITRRNLIKIIIALSIMEYSLNLFFILIGYRKGGEIPILKDAGAVPPVVVDPLPQAMILTAIVIGLATTALLLAIAIRLYRKYKTFDVSGINALKG